MILVTRSDVARVGVVAVHLMKETKIAELRGIIAQLLEGEQHLHHHHPIPSLIAPLEKTSPTFADDFRNGTEECYSSWICYLGRFGRMPCDAAFCGGRRVRVTWDRQREHSFLQF